MSTIKTTTLSTQGGSTVPVDTVVNGTAKAWVNFNGQGTVAIRRAFNVSSITDNATGSFTLNFTTALPDTNYALLAMSGRGSVNYDEGAGQDWLTLPTTSSCRIWIGSSNGGKGDYPYAHVAIFS